MFIALLPPPTLKAPLHAQHYVHARQQCAVITLLHDDYRTLPAVARTVASLDRRQASLSVSTSSSYPDQVPGLAVIVEPPESTPGMLAHIGLDDRVPFMLAEIKRLTGWSWERVAEALDRSRQAVHAWTLGKEISQPNLERLAGLYASLAFIDRGNAEQNRALLHTATADGSLVADLLDASRFAEVRALLGPGTGSGDRTARQQFVASVEHDNGKPHWFDRLAEHVAWNREARGQEQPLEIILSGGRKRVVPRRRG